jgi:ankyrin repeat protein
MHNLLLAEHRKFMSKQSAARAARIEAENNAARMIQTTFRGHFVRMNLAEIRHYSEVHKQIRSNIRSYLANKYSLTLSMMKYKRTLANLRNKSAVAIQCAYFRYLSRKCLRRRRYALWLQRRKKAAVRIQAMVRGVSARARVKLLVERLQIVLFNKSATSIQAAARRHLARRRVHRRRYRLYCVASRIIINWYRMRYTRKMAAHIKAMLQFRRNQHGAMAMQGLVRKFLAKRRVNRIRLRRLHKLIFRYVTVIQSLVRRFICRVRVQHKRVEVRTAKEASDARLAQQRAEDAAAAEAAETKQLHESVDIFLQARSGNTTGVVDIFTGLASTDEHSRDEVEPGTGDNLLTVAAAQGNVELIRKCLQWGFDLNHRNDMGLNALMVAAKHNCLSAMQYLLAPPVSAAESETPYTPLDPISEEDAGFLLVTAAANCVIADDTSMLVKVLSLGVDVNAKNATTGMTAVHAACEVGHVEAFKLLVKHKADLEVEDDLGQTPLHKACCNSFKITEMILGLDPTFSAYMSDATRSASILKVDGDGKDCILHAALNGQTDTLDLLSSTVQTGQMRAKSGKFNASGDAGSEEIGWSPSDISKAIHLVETGNLLCLNKIQEIGFDVSWVEEETGRTLAIAACQCCDADMVDLLMSFGVDFSVADLTGRTAAHYAAECNSTALLPHLLMHAAAAKCNINDTCLLHADKASENVYHIAARRGVELKIDLLAQRVQKEALEARNNDGKTPILVACVAFKLDVVRSYLKLGADPLAQDSNGRGCLWHLFHPGPGLNRRPLCSEYILHPSTATTPGGSAAALSRREKDEEIARVASELTLVIALLRAGCLLYTDAHSPCTPESLSAELAYKWNEAPSAASQAGFQCGDVMVQEISLTLLKAVIQDGLLRPYDAWRLSKFTAVQNVVILVLTFISVVRYSVGGVLVRRRVTEDRHGIVQGGHHRSSVRLRQRRRFVGARWCRRSWRSSRTRTLFRAREALGSRTGERAELRRNPAAALAGSVLWRVHGAGLGDQAQPPQGAAVLPAARLQGDHARRRRGQPCDAPRGDLRHRRDG